MKRLPALAGLALVLLLACTGSAQAEFVPLPAPCAAGGIGGFAISGSTWLAVCVEATPGYPRRSYVNAVRLSGDGGQSWNTLALDPTLTAPGPPYMSGVTVGPDGAFYFGAVLASAPEGTAGRIVRVSVDGTPTLVGGVVPVPGTTGTASVSAPAFDATGRMWIAYTSGKSVPNASFTLASRGDDGTWTPAAPAVTIGSGVAGTNVSVRILPSGPYVTEGGRSTYLLRDGALVPATLDAPAYTEGDLRIDGQGVSLDGGASYVIGNTDWQYTPVEGNPALFAVDRQLMRRASPAVFAPSGVSFTGARYDRLLRLIQDGDRVVAVTDESRSQLLDGDGRDNQLAAHTGPLPAPTASGPLSATLTGWLGIANGFRGSMGLPPLVGDPLMSQAAENHSRYSQLNRGGDSFHDETPGKPGYTGSSPLERCQAVGAACNGAEIVYSDGMDRPVEGWIATLYHRFLLLNPLNVFIGGGRVSGGSSVMDGLSAFSFAGENGFLVTPVEFPTGRYDGDLSFSGETPDPADACKQVGQPVTQPYGTAVTAWVPAGTLGPFTVAPLGGAPLAGCSLVQDGSASGSFVPEASLQPHTTYVARTTWTPNAQMGPRPLQWQFTTGTGDPADEPAGDGKAPGGRKPAACKSALAVPHRTVKRRHSVTVTYKTCGRAKLTSRLYRLDRRGKAARRSSAHRTSTIKKATRAHTTAPTKKLRAGRYRLELALTGSRPRHVAVTIRVR